MKSNCSRVALIVESMALFYYLLSPMSSVRAALTCSGVQAGNEQTSAGQNYYIGSGQTIHVNISGSGLSPAGITDVENGINSWVGTSGITVVYDNSSPGPGVVTILASTSIQALAQTETVTGGPGYAPNQIANATIYLNLGFAYPCSTGACPAYNSNGSNADNFLEYVGAHEMGHALGLDNTPDSDPNATPPGNPCTQTSTSVMGGYCGTNNTGDNGAPPAPSSVTSSLCDKQNVSTQTKTAGVPSTPPSSGPGVGGGGGGGAGNPGSGGGGGGGTGIRSCNWYEEWDGETLSEYEVCTE